MALPVRHGGLGIINPTINNRYHHQSSENITAPLVSLILEQSHTYHQEAKAEQLKAKNEAMKQRKQLDSAAAAEIEDKLPNNLKRAIQGCICGHSYTIEYALICSRGGFPSIRHNELRDITAGFLTEVCHNVGIEPPLQPLSGEQLILRSANREDGARLDIAADDFWGRDRNRAFLT